VETFTFLFTDIEGSTALLGRVGQQVYAQILAEHHALIRSVLAARDGRELNTLGDGFFAAFPSPRQCAAAVLAMQQALETHAWPGGECVRVRMGVHTGEGAQTAATGMLGAPGLQASFPQLRSLGNPVLQNNLPVQPAARRS
jgi:class 3 adenylate cyclase